jgi:hypothetical protein
MANSFDINEYLVNLQDFEPRQSVPVCVPRKPFRIEKGSARYGYLICSENQWYLLHPELSNDHDISGIQKATLYQGIFDDGESFILPVTHPEPGKNPSWYDGWMNIVDAAQKRWVLASKNVDARCYLPKEVKGPKTLNWPDWDMEYCLELAFWNRHIDTLEHRVIVEASNKANARYDLDHPQF